MLIRVHEHPHHARSPPASPAPSSQGCRNKDPLPLSQHTGGLPVFYCTTTKAQTNVGRLHLSLSWASPWEGDKVPCFKSFFFLKWEFSSSDPSTGTLPKAPVLGLIVSRRGKASQPTFGFLCHPLQDIMSLNSLPVFPCPTFLILVLTSPALHGTQLVV